MTYDDRKTRSDRDELTECPCDRYDSEAHDSLSCPPQCKLEAHDSQR
jgi:hypothetical protein